MREVCVAIGLWLIAAGAGAQPRVVLDDDGGADARVSVRLAAALIHAVDPQVVLRSDTAADSVHHVSFLARSLALDTGWRPGDHHVSYGWSPLALRRYVIFEPRGAAGIACAVTRAPEERCLPTGSVALGGPSTRIHIPRDAAGGLLLVVSDRPTSSTGGLALIRSASVGSMHAAVLALPGVDALDAVELPGNAHAVVRAPPAPLTMIATDGWRTTADGRVVLGFRVRVRARLGARWREVPIEKVLGGYQVSARVAGRPWPFVVHGGRGWLALGTEGPARHEVDLQLIPRSPGVRASGRTRVTFAARAARRLTVRAGAGTSCVDLPRGVAVRGDILGEQPLTQYRLWAEGLDSSGVAGPGARLCGRAPPWQLGHPRMLAAWVNPGGEGGERPLHLTVKMVAQPEALWIPLGLYALALVLFGIAHGARRVPPEITHVAFRRVLPGYRDTGPGWTVIPIPAMDGGELPLLAIDPRLGGAGAGLALERRGTLLRVSSEAAVVASAPGSGVRLAIGSFLAVPEMVIDAAPDLRLAFLTAQTDAGSLREPSLSAIEESRAAGLAGELVPEVPREPGTLGAFVRATAATALSVGVAWAACELVPAGATISGFAAAGATSVLVCGLVALVALSRTSAGGRRGGCGRWWGGRSRSTRSRRGSRC